jgi:molybdopterin biosynthesis enzyme
MQLFEKLIEQPEAVRLVFENTHRLPAGDVPLVEARGLALAEDVVRLAAVRQLGGGRLRGAER